VFGAIPLGWVDIGTGTKVPLKFVTYISKVTKKSVLTQWTSWVSKDAEFYVDFKNINLP
jgi:hypothetical protein